MALPFNLPKVLLASACALSLATLPLALPASAQTGTSSTDTGTMSRQGADPTRNDRGSDWSWLGLLGLLGLAGLKRKPEQNQVYRDPNESSRSGSRI